MARQPRGGGHGAAVRVLNVAEKNDAAKSIAQILSGGNATRVN